MYNNKYFPNKKFNSKLLLIFVYLGSFSTNHIQFFKEIGYKIFID